MKIGDIRSSTRFLLVIGMILFLAPTTYHTLFPLHLISNSTSSINPIIIITQPEPELQAVSILFPSWQVLLLLPASASASNNNHHYVCLYTNGTNTSTTTPAIPSGTIPFPHRLLFMCHLPTPLRRPFPLPTPALALPNLLQSPQILTQPQELLRWNFIAYETLTTQNDVLLFVKGVNNRHGLNRPPRSLTCLFGAVRTPVTTSSQEVFRCQTPKLTAAPPTKASLEFLRYKDRDRVVVPSVAHYAPSRKLKTNNPNGKSLLCACTMVYNVAKFLKEWILYHSRIGVHRFILYDNHSDDELKKIVSDLVNEGYDVETLFWVWPKTQEAGFSHCAIYANKSCKWMMYMDVDEFLYSPAWSNLSNPSTSLIPSMISSVENSELAPVGQIMIGCHEFGPSNQSVHPAQGVTQGYNCRKRMENRHKSIVLLEAVDESLSNVIHHFDLKSGYRSEKVRIEEAVVNHYKFQAWPEFKSKFRRRVSAYVVDWTQNVNPKSNDRTPGLGFTPLEPQGWPHKFCEVYDN